MTFYEGAQGRPQALRKWFWPGDLDGQEFLYPKAQAAEISKRTKEKVPEGDLPTVKESGQILTPDLMSPYCLRRTMPGRVSSIAERTASVYPEFSLSVSYVPKSQLNTVQALLISAASVVEVQ